MDTTATELEAPIAARRSVVLNSYKVHYANKAATARGKKGVSKRVVADSCGDWLALELAAVVRPDPKVEANIDAFLAILDANGVAHNHWNRTTKGWQGRIRMTGRLALQRVVAGNEGLAMPNGAFLAAPKSWVAKHAN